MTRQGFLDRLRANLRGRPPHTVDDIVADYDAHFAEGLAAGRTEAQVAEALGDPDRLARELRAQATIQRWEEDKNPAAAFGAIIALLGLGALDIFILLPILVTVIGVLSTLYLVAGGVLIGGVGTMIFGPFVASGGVFAVILFGLGLTAAAICALAAMTLISVGLVNALIGYGRLHFRLLTPAMSSKGDRA